MAWSSPSPEPIIRRMQNEFEAETGACREEKKLESFSEKNFSFVLIVAFGVVVILQCRANWKTYTRRDKTKCGKSLPRLFETSKILYKQEMFMMLGNSMREFNRVATVYKLTKVHYSSSKKEEIVYDFF